MPDIPLDTLFIVAFTCLICGQIDGRQSQNNKRAPMSKPQSESDGRENSENKGWAIFLERHLEKLLNQS